MTDRLVRRLAPASEAELHFSDCLHFAQHRNTGHDYAYRWSSFGELDSSAGQEPLGRESLSFRRKVRFTQKSEVLSGIGQTFTSACFHRTREPELITQCIACVGDWNRQDEWLLRLKTAPVSLEEQRFSGEVQISLATGAVC